MTCKCGAASYEAHQDTVAAKQAAAHVYSGPFWSAPNSPDPKGPR